MNILIVSATKFEVSPILDYFRLYRVSENVIYYNKNIYTFIQTGIGLTNTTYILTKELLKQKYNLVINVGICGSFSQEIPIGKIVNIVTDTFGDLGITHPGNFTTCFEENFDNPNAFPYKNGRLENVDNMSSQRLSLQKVNSISVNSASGNAEQIKMRIEKFNPDVESMEGAAFFYVCISEKVPCLQIRSVSNFVEPRNKERWNIPVAINNLSSVICAYLIDPVKSFGPL